jgi:D-serine dehydratase
MMEGKIEPFEKGLGCLTSALGQEEIVALGWNLLREDLGLPVAVLYEEKLRHNLHWMQEFVARYGVKLAPHGKTTMAPKLFAMQMQAGAWGITLATAQQTQAAYAHGVRRVLMANQLVGRANMAKVSSLLEDADFEYFCTVDSAQNVAALGEYFKERGQKLNVLIELGAEGGRAGVRDDAALQILLDELARWKGSIALCGVEVYEGVLADEVSIRAFLRRAVETTKMLAMDGRIDREPALLSGAGSAWYDVVAQEFAGAGVGIEVVLRPGCYLTHDVGVYRAAQQRIDAHNPIAAEMQSSLQPALQLWAYVQSIPEPTRPIIALGKRDAAFDAGLPVPALHFRQGMPAPVAIAKPWKLTKMMDQHAYLQIEPGDDLEVGDMIGFDISHPCLTFDKWKLLPIVNAQFDVVEAVETFF